MHFIFSGKSADMPKFGLGFCGLENDKAITASLKP